MLTWFEMLLMQYCGLLEMSLTCNVCVKCGSYTYVMKFSSNEHKRCSFIQISF